MYGFISGLSILVHWSTCLFLCWYHTLLITVALPYSLKSGHVIPPALIISLKIALAIWISCSSYVKNTMNILIVYMCAQSCLTLCDPVDCSPPNPSLHRIFQARNTREDCHFLLQIFLTQWLNSCLLCLLHLQMDSLPLAPPGKLHILIGYTLNK